MTKTEMKPAVKGTYGTMYYVKDMAKAVKFYKEKLGLSAGYESPEWTEFALKGHSLCLHAAEPRKEFENGALILHVDGIKELVAGLKAKGVKIVSDVKEVHPGASSASFLDEDGNVVSFYEGPKNG